MPKAITLFLSTSPYSSENTPTSLRIADAALDKGHTVNLIASAVFSEPPTFLVAFEFLLALAPTATVPLFVTYNALAIVGTLRERKA